MCELNSMISSTLDGYFRGFQVFHFISLPNILSSISQKPLSRIVELKGMCIFSFGRYFLTTSPKWLHFIPAVDASLIFIYFIYLFSLFFFGCVVS